MKKPAQLQTAPSSLEPDGENGFAPWTANVAGLAGLGERLATELSDPQDIVLRQELHRYMYSAMAQGYFALIYQDTKYPDFWPTLNQAFNIGFPNPDDIYYMAVVEGGGVYQISGLRGSVYIVDFQIGSGDFIPYGRGEFGPTLHNYDIDRDARVAADGGFNVILSAERPAGYKGDWWRLDPAATFIWVRQRSYDWAREVDGRFGIERLDLPAIRPRDGAQKIAASLQQIPSFTENWTQFALHFFNDRLRAKQLVNKVEVINFGGVGGISDQRYVQGMFDLQPDEALILETEIPAQCRYWNFQLTDELSSAIDPVNRQTSLNGHSAQLGSDGKFRAVISAVDPGVPNWLDNAGYVRGNVYGRWKECDSYPQPNVRRVKVADVRQYLPAETPVVSAAERDTSLRARRKAAQMRRRW